MIGQFEGRLGGEATITTPEGHVIRTENGHDWWLEGTDPGAQKPSLDERLRDVEELAHWFDLLAVHDAYPIECLPSQWARYAELLRELNARLGLCHEKNAELVAKINELEHKQFVSAI